MKRKISVFLIVGFVVSLCALTILAQEEEQEAQAYYLMEVVVKPSMIAEYEAAVKEIASLNSQYQSTYPWNGFSAVDFHYYFSIPMKNLADIDNMYKEDSKLNEKMGEEKSKEIEKRFAGTYEYVRECMIYSSPDLSYTPKSPRLQPDDEANYRFWIWYYVQPEKIKEFQEVLKKFVALAKSKNVTDGYDIYSGGIGMDVPAYIVAFVAKSAADFEVNYEKTWELLGEEGKELMQKLVALTRKREIKTGWFRPDLSYIPKEK
jgi:hypothetical protein